MAYEQKLNQGSLFKADKKTDKHPDLTGTIKLNDGDYFISAWKKTGQKGEFLSISVKKKEAQGSQGTQNMQGMQSNDLPF